MSETNESRKKKQMMLAGVGATVLIGVTLGGIFLMDGETVTEPTDPIKTVNIATPGDVDDRDAWRAQQSSQEKSNEMRIEELGLAVNQQLAEKQELMIKMEQMNADITEAKNEARLASTRAANASVSASSLPSYPAPPQIQSGLAGPSILPNPNGNGQTVTVGGMTFPNGQVPGTNPVVKRTVEIIDFKEGGTTNGQTSVSTVAENNKTVEEDLEFIPPTTFVRALILNGADVPTGGQAQSNPLPITLQVTDVANLPNKYKVNLKDCRFLAAGWGDLSSERMLGRVESMSCIINGKATVMPVRGYLIGEDGKAGVRGRLVSKRGQILANSLLAGIATSTGEVISGTANTVTTTALGTTKVVDPDQVGRAALGGGLSGTARSLAEYYMKQADLLYPVIETDAGRVIEVLITDGVSFPKSAGISSRNRNVVQQATNGKRILSND